MKRFRYKTAFGCAALVALCVASFAFASESTNWLISNPASMMDWGSQKAKEDAQRAVDSLNLLMDSRAKQDFDFQFSDVPDEVKKKTIEDRKNFPYPKQYGFRYVYGYAGYDQPKDRIEVGAAVVTHPKSPYPGKIDVESCAALMGDFRETLLIFGTTKDDAPLRSALQWFSHGGYELRGMPPNFAADLVRHIVTAIDLDTYPNADPKVKCEQPLDGGPITSVVKQEK